MKNNYLIIILSILFVIIVYNSLKHLEYSRYGVFALIHNGKFTMLKEKLQADNEKYDCNGRTKLTSAFKMRLGGINKYNPQKHEYVIKEIIKILLEHGENPNEIDNDRFGSTPLHYAVTYGKITPEMRVNIMKLLIEYGADINIQDGQGNTSLHIAMQYINFNIAKYLIDNGADLNIINNEGKTPIDIAKEINNKEAINYLNKLKLPS